MKKFLLPLLVILPSLTHCQSLFSRGFIVTTSSDTISGYIEEKYWLENPDQFKFKRDLKDQIPQTLGINDVKLVKIIEGDIYERFSVNVSLDKIGKDDLNSYSDNKTEARTVFLKLLNAGKVASLYEYSDSIKTRYYLAEPNIDPVELEFHKIIEDNQTRNKNKFIGQLLYLADKSGLLTSKLRNKIENSSYQENSLMNIFEDLNQTKHKRIKSRNQLTFFAGVNANVSWLNVKGNNPYLTGDVSDNSSLFPSVSVGFDILDKKNINRVTIRTEVYAWQKDAQLTTTDINDAQTAVSQFSYLEKGISLQPKILYRVSHLSKYTVFAGFGPTINYASVSSQNFSTTYYVNNFTYFETYTRPEMQKLYFSFLLQAGIRIMDRLEVNGAFISAFNRTNYKPYRITDKTATVGIIYRLKVQKKN